MRTPIYMDYQATTPVDPRVLQRMLPFFSESFGNAASRSHAFGWQADAAVTAARKQVAQLIGADPTEIVFTSGATEANNLAIAGVAEARRAQGNHIITQATEHKAVLDVCQALVQRGFRLTVLPVDSTGRVHAEQLEQAIENDTVLVSLMAANNEIGTLQPLAELGAVCRARGVLFHTDAAQLAGKLSFSVHTSNVDLASLSAHKMYGPKGVGALYVRRKNPRVDLQAQILGGGHERGRRSGTLNVPGIVGFGAAAQLCEAELSDEPRRVGALRDRLETAIFSGLTGVFRNGAEEARLPGCANLRFEDVDAEPLMLALRNVALSSGAACTSADLAPSHVLLALGLSPTHAHRALRFGLGRMTTSEEVDAVSTQVIEQVTKLRRLGIRGISAKATVSSP